MEGEIAAKFLAAVVAQPKVKRLLSSDHFSVDGTLFEAWASPKSFRRTDGRRQRRDGQRTQRRAQLPQGEALERDISQRTDPEVRLYKKGDGQPAKLCYFGHALMENRHGLVVGGGASLATGTAEREEVLALIDGRCGKRRITQGTDKAYDVADFVASLRYRSVSPHHIAIDGHLSKTGKPLKTAVDGRVTRHIGYVISPRCRKRIEEVFGWIKASAGLAKVKLRGRARVDAVFTIAVAAYNLIRLLKLLATA